jgi:hypothetical protein
LADNAEGTMTTKRSFLAAALLGVAILAGCDPERPVRPRPGEPLFSLTTSEPFFVAWSNEHWTSPIFTVGGSFRADAYRQPAWWTWDQSYGTWAQANPGRLYIVGDEPDNPEHGCLPPAVYADSFFIFVDLMRGYDATAKFSPAGFTEPGSGHCGAGTDTVYAQAFYDAYSAKYGPPPITEWRFHNFGNWSINNYAKWKSDVQALAAWSVAHGAPMYLGGWGFIGWTEPQTTFLQHVTDAMAFLSADGRIRGAGWWSYEQIGFPHYLKNPDGSLTPEGHTYYNGPSFTISGPSCVSPGSSAGYYAMMIDDALTPISVNWYRDFEWIGNTNPVTYNGIAGTHILRADVTDRYGVLRSQSKTIPNC